MEFWMYCTFGCHAHVKALPITAVLAEIACIFVDNALTVFGTNIPMRISLLDRTTEESLKYRKRENINSDN